MTEAPEDSPCLPRASNAFAAQAWSHLGLACREAARRPAGPERIEQVLRLAIEASGAERAFVVVSSPRPGNGRGLSVHSRCSIRGDGCREPSRSVLRRALAGRRAFICPDVASDPPLADGASVRSLVLRSVLSAPVPVPPPTRAALVLDSREPLPLAPGQLGGLAEAFAALVGLSIRVPGGREPSPGSTTGVAPSPAEGPPLPTGRSPALRRMLEWTRRVASSDLPALVEGESGSGKERICRAIHALSPRRSGPFVAVNCTALTESLLDAELFGVVRGAYTGSDRDRPGLFRLADGGTLLMDEVGDTPLPMQAKLLRAVQEGRVRPVGGDREVPVDVRVIAATHYDLERRVARGRFRADLFYRLAMLQIRVPSLRERIDDLPLLVAELAPRLEALTGCGPLKLTPLAWEALRNHDWPGNVRELQAVLARALLCAAGAEVDAVRLGPLGRGRPGDARERQEPTPLERAMIEEALHEARGSVATAAARIGWTRQKLYRRMRALAVTRSRGKKGQLDSGSRTTSSESSTFQ